MVLKQGKKEKKNNCDNVSKPAHHRDQAWQGQGVPVGWWGEGAVVMVVGEGWVHDSLHTHPGLTVKPPHL